MHCRQQRITDGQKVSVFCVCGEALSLVGRNNKSAGKGSTNIQRSRNNKIQMEIQLKSTNIQRSRNNKIQMEIQIQTEIQQKVPTYNALEIIKYKWK